MTRIDSVLRWVGAAAGIALAVALILSWRVAADGGPLPAEVTMQADPAGELELRPAAAFLSALELEAGGRGVSGSLTLRNITPVTLEVRVRLEPSSSALDRALVVRLEGGGRQLAKARLGELRRWSAASIRLGPGRAAVVRARVSIPARPAAAEAGGQDVAIAADFHARPAGGAR